MPKPLFLLFDGNSLVHRAYHALPPLTVKKTGEMVNAVYGFALMFLKVINDLKPTHYAVAFDKKGPTFRHQLFEEYKATRKATPDELVAQLERVRDVVRTFNIPIFEMEGYEADDLLGSLSEQASKQDVDTVIVTGDADAMQLVSSHIKVYAPKGRFSDAMSYDETAVEEKYGVKPQQMTDLKALMGDTSDNIPGVPGIGEKTGAKLLRQFGSLEQIYAHIDEVMPVRLQAILREHVEQAKNSKVLATIDTKAPAALDLEKCQIGNCDYEKINELFRELEFFSLIPRLQEMKGNTICLDTATTKPPAADAPQCVYNVINTLPQLEELARNLAQAQSFAFDTETTGLDAMSAQLVGMSFSIKTGAAYYVPVGHIGLLVQTEQLPLDIVLNKLKPALESNSTKLAHNGNFDMTVLAENGIQVQNLTFDTMIAAHLLGEKNLNLKGLAFARLGIDARPISDLIGTGAKKIPMSQVDIKSVTDYACADADLTLQLSEIFRRELQQQDLWRLFTEVEMPLVPILVSMERAGVLLDTNLLRQMSQKLGEQLLRIEARIYDTVGHRFNINSPQQLSAVLFEELHLPPTRRTKVHYSTGAAVLEELRGVHPIIDLILEYRQLSKLKSTYIDALPAAINLKTGRVHTSFNQTQTATGRLSSSDPNLQNIPIRGELGREIRKAFIAPPGSQLLAGDYSQIDLRALAHLSQDKNLLEAFHNDQDIHAATAAQLFGVKNSDVTPDMRRLAKTVNFGVIYGMSEYGLEQATELSRGEAGKFITAYFEQYPGVRTYFEATKQQAREKGYVQTILERKRYIPEINSPNHQIKESAERMAINMPVQGTSADIIKVAMINLHREIEKRQLKSKMLLQVHDELIFEVPEAEIAEMRQLVPQVMSTSLSLSVPLKVEIKTGQNWGEME